MTSQSNQYSYILGILCITLILISGKKEVVLSYEVLMILMLKILEKHNVTHICIKLIIFFVCSGFVTSLRVPTLDSSCVLQSKENRRVCCIEDCSPNCDADCKSRGYPKGGSCDPRTGNELCCCFME